eukprot:TRINITY_DN25985_c0_g1_i1.p1 TRINITY_DN25985_c0_g1~~TRINITY_DN25985_c0_g1_i1.p1  ORF type:complete len:332 (+),score=86.15 TRINITY_DN25985_c0_g1_i1:143-1138(+)
MTDVSWREHAWRWAACGAASAAAYLAWKVRHLQEDVAAAARLCEAERKGRTKAEKKLVAAAAAALPVAPIGTASSPFYDLNGTPRQPGLVPSSVSTIRLHPTVNSVMLKALEDYSHVYVLWWFHKNTNVGKGFDAMKGLVSPPRAGGAKVGVFACRTPHRPNPIGLSLVEVRHVDAQRGVLKVAALDVVDGTPVLDIKPYIPHVEAVPRARCPAWVSARDGEGDTPSFSVCFTDAAADDVDHYNDMRTGWSDLRRFLVDTLRTDFRSARQKALPHFHGSLRLQRLQVDYTIDTPAQRITVHAVGPRAAVGEGDINPEAVVPDQMTNGPTTK